jgi:hypothetical protein
MYLLSIFDAVRRINHEVLFVWSSNEAGIGGGREDLKGADNRISRH